jgi:sugar lactone lactonase YvrE
MSSRGTLPLLTTATAIVFSVGVVSAAEPQKLWQATGLKNPESAVFDSASGAIYVSNINGSPMTKDGNGFISKIGPDGRVIALEWVKGLDAPTGLTLVAGTLYAADVDKVVVIDIATETIKERYEAPGAGFLNDLTADKEGRVYASDMVTNSIWIVEDGKVSMLLQDEMLRNPNGLLALDGGRLVVCSWGVMAPDFSTEVPGHMLIVDPATKTVSDMGDPAPVGNLDGVVPDGKGGYLVTDWMKGVLFRVASDGKATRLMSLRPGSADLGPGPGQNVVLIPMMNEGTLDAYEVD